VFHAIAVRNTAKYARAVVRPPDGVRHDWRIVADLTARLLAHRDGAVGRLAGAALRAGVRRKRPRDLLALALRFGPRARSGVSLAALEAQPHGMDLGPLEPRLPGILRTPGQRVQLVPDVMVAELARLEARLGGGAARANGTLLLINRRDLRSNNSWMHNVRRLVKGGDRCTVLLHPEDAARRGIREGQRVRVTSRVGAIELVAEITADVMPGVASIPHGWGHDVPGVKMRIASVLGGASVNDISDDAMIDPVSGCAALSGIPISIEILAGS
jgi:anaerobic selenocysteine-containing dehydrogenase